MDNRERRNNYYRQNSRGEYDAWFADVFTKRPKLTDRQRRRLKQKSNRTRHLGL